MVTSTVKARHSLSVWAKKWAKTKQLFDCLAFKDVYLHQIVEAERRNMRSQSKTMLMFLAIASENGWIQRAEFTSLRDEDYFCGWQCFTIVQPDVFRSSLYELFAIPGPCDGSESSLKTKEKTIQNFFRLIAKMQPKHWSDGFKGTEPFVHIARPRKQIEARCQDKRSLNECSLILPSDTLYTIRSPSLSSGAENESATSQVKKSPNEAVSSNSSLQHIIESRPELAPLVFGSERCAVLTSKWCLPSFAEFASMFHAEGMMAAEKWPTVKSGWVEQIMPDSAGKFMGSGPF